MWYLKSKNYITLGDNAASALTALGVDFVESNRVKVALLNKLLTGGAGPIDGGAASKALNPPGEPLNISTANGASEVIDANEKDEV